MIHVGNDIVDLASPYVTGKSSDRKFVQRVLTPGEHRIFLISDDPDNLLQVFWAAKETAYKIAVKRFPGVSSAPQRYEVRLHKPEHGSALRGRVRTPPGAVHVAVQQHPDFIHCFGTETVLSGKNVILGVETTDRPLQPDFCRCSEVQSRMVRSSAGRKIASALCLSENDIAITRINHEKGRLFPEVYIKRKKADIDISLSHDGRFMAYAFLIQTDALH